MWYTLPYANTFICTPAHGGRAGHLGDRPPVLVRLYGTPLSNPPRQCRGSVDDHHGARSALHRPDRAPDAACVPPARSHGAGAAIVTSTHDGHDLRRGHLRVSPGAGAPESTDVRQAYQPGDTGAGRRGLLRRGVDAAAGQRRGHSGGPPPAERVLEARQTLAYQSRSGLCPKKNGAPS